MIGGRDCVATRTATIDIRDVLIHVVDSHSLVILSHWKDG